MYFNDKKTGKSSRLSEEFSVETYYEKSPNLYEQETEDNDCGGYKKTDNVAPDKYKYKDYYSKFSTYYN